MKQLSMGIVVCAMALFSYTYAAQTSISFTILPLPGSGDITPPPVTGEIITGGTMSGGNNIPLQFAGGRNISNGRGNTISGFVLGSAPDTGDLQEMDTVTLIEWGKHYGLISGESELPQTISRLDLARLLTLFVQNVWSIGIHDNPRCDMTKYQDYHTITPEERQYVQAACNLGLMGRNGTRTGLTMKFNPHQIVTRDQLATIFSRLLYGNAYDNKSADKWYEGHMRIMLSEGFITKPNPSIIESTSNILTILRRIARAIPNGTIMINTSAATPRTGDELQKAYDRAKEHQITPLPSYDTGVLYKELSRGDLAHMLTMFSKNILGKISIGTDACTIENYSDFTGMSANLSADIKEVCNLGLMGRTGSGSMLAAFRPYDIVIRAELGAVLSRMLYGNTYDHVAEGKAWYEEHLHALLIAGYLTKIDTPLMTERYGYVLIILQRMAKKLQPSL